jgi:hypothetical protein
VANFQGSYAIERTRGGLGGLPAGNYEVKVRFAGSGSVPFTVADWNLTVERSQVG